MILSAQPKIATCLWFDGNGLEAAEFYVSLVPHSKITSTFQTDLAAPPLVISFVLGGSPYQALNGGPQFTHSEAASIVVTTKDQTETDYLWNSLIAKGGCESQCGWLKDRFGVSWQVVPEKLTDLLMAEDRVAAYRAAQALMSMKKIEIGKIESAFAGE